MSPTIEAATEPQERDTPESLLFADLNTLVDTHLQTVGLTEFEREDIRADAKRMYQIVKNLNDGQGAYGMHLNFEPNELSYHRFEHTISVTRRAIQMLPGFLLDSSTSCPPDVTTAVMVKNFLRAALLHEIGFLTPHQSTVYDIPGSLSYDHVDRGMEYSSLILRSQAFEAEERDISIVRKLIKSTDFNVSWPVKTTQHGIDGSLTEWGRLLWAADFEAAFADPDNVPRYIQELFAENNAAAIIDGVVQHWKRDPETGRVIYNSVSGKPETEASPDPDNDFVTIHQVKYAREIRDVPEYPFDPPVMDFYAFVTSMFTLDMASVLEEYIRYADVWYGDASRNEIDIQYAINREKIRLLQEKTTIPTRDPFTIFEGAVKAEHLSAWVRRLEREGFIPSGFRLDSATWKSVNARVLYGSRHDGALERLVTGEIRQVLRALVAKEKLPLAISYLLEQVREAMQGEHIEDVLVSFAPGAYISDEPGGVFGDFSESLLTFTEAFGMLSHRDGLPMLRPEVIIRRNRDFDNKPEAMSHIANILNTAYTANTIAGISFLGREREPLVTYRTFFESLDIMPITLVIGQTFPHERTQPNYLTHQRELIQTNLAYAYSLAERFPVALWGLQDLSLLTDEEIHDIVHGASYQPNVYLSLTFDVATGLITEPYEHPAIRLFADRGKVSSLPIQFVRANPALTASGSIRLDIFTWLWRHDPDIQRVGAKYELLLRQNGTLFWVDLDRQA